MKQRLLFPVHGKIDFVSTRSDEKCPHCGENRITDCIYGHLTFLCGASRRGKETTPCSKDRWVPFVVEPKL